MIAPATQLVEFRSQWWVPHYTSCTICFMCRGKLYHTEKEHRMIVLAVGGYA